MRGSEMASGRRRVPLVALYTVALAVFSVYVLLDTFVIARTYAAAVTVDKTATTRSTSLVGQELDAAGTASGASQSGGTQAADPATANAADTSSQETDATSSASATSITQVRYEDTTVYVVDVYTNDVTNLLSAFAQDTYGKNVTSTTSAMAQANGATVAINGDYYGARNAGYVIRNGVLYRDTVASSSQEDLVIYSDGSFEIITEGSVTATSGYYLLTCMQRLCHAQLLCAMLLDEPHRKLEDRLAVNEAVVAHRDDLKRHVGFRKLWRELALLKGDLRSQEGDVGHLGKLRGR